MLYDREKIPEVDCSTGLDKVVTGNIDEVGEDYGSSDGKDAQIMLSSTTTILDAPLRTGRWTPDEKILFLYGLKRFGKGRWKKISVYLPHRSLVQIKSHAQKVLKRLDAGENIFRRLEENYRDIDSLVVQAAIQRDAIRGAGINVTSTTAPSKPLSTVAKRRRQAKVSRTVDCIDDEECQQVDLVPTELQGYDVEGVKREGEMVESGQAVIAAAALCQLSSLATPWDQQGVVVNPIERQSEV